MLSVSLEKVCFSGVAGLLGSSTMSIVSLLWFFESRSLSVGVIVLEPDCPSIVFFEDLDSGSGVGGVIVEILRALSTPTDPSGLIFIVSSRGVSRKVWSSSGSLFGL